MKVYTFLKTGKDWYIDLPEFIEQGGSIGDLQMIDGADVMLDIIADNDNSVSLNIAKDKFEGADVLVLTEKCDPYIGGGYYFMKQYEGQEINRQMWLCQVTDFVFGEISIIGMIVFEILLIILVIERPPIVFFSHRYCFLFIHFFREFWPIFTFGIDKNQRERWM